MENEPAAWPTDDEVMRLKCRVKRGERKGGGGRSRFRQEPTGLWPVGAVPVPLPGPVQEGRRLEKADAEPKMGQISPVKRSARMCDRKNECPVDLDLTIY